jgi:Leucine-rich repeat (LRR) protein
MHARVHSWFTATNLSLTAQAVAELPWSHLETVDCRDNFISSLDDSLRLFPMVSLFDLSHNELNSLTTDLKHLRNLISLNLSHNKLASLRPMIDVDVITACKRLTTLDISHNKLTSLLGVEGLSALEDLNAAHNLIDSVDEIRCGLVL